MNQSKLFLFSFCSLLVMAFGAPAIFATSQVMAAAPQVDEPVPEISCTGDLTATVFAENLSQPDGLAFDSAGNLYVAEELAGQITKLEPGGVKTVLMSGLSFPEGIIFDANDNLYVVEDVVDTGTLIQRTPEGVETTIDAALSSPEGVAIGPDGTIYVTASDAEKAAGTDITLDNFGDFRTYLYAYDPDDSFARTTLLDIAPDVAADLANSKATLDSPSFAGVTVGADGMVYITSESAGITVVQDVDTGFPFGIIELTISSNRSVFKVDPAAGPATMIGAAFAEDIVVPEGLRFSNAGFPLLVVEEGFNNANPSVGSEEGKLISVDSAGETTVLCTGLKALEDVVVGSDGAIYVSEDSTNRVIKLAPNGPPPTETPFPAATMTATPATTPFPTPTESSSTIPTREPSPTPVGTLEPPTTGENKAFLPLIGDWVQSMIQRMRN